MAATAVAPFRPATAPGDQTPGAGDDVVQTAVDGDDGVVNVQAIIDDANANVQVAVNDVNVQTPVDDGDGDHEEAEPGLDGSTSTEPQDEFEEGSL